MVVSYHALYNTCKKNCSINPQDTIAIFSQVYSLAGLHSGLLLALQLPKQLLSP